MERKSDEGGKKKRRKERERICAYIFKSGGPLFSPRGIQTPPIEIACMHKNALHDVKTSSKMISLFKFKR
jgi:hypothetical protein